MTLSSNAGSADRSGFGHCGVKGDLGQFHGHGGHHRHQSAAQVFARVVTTSRLFSLTFRVTTSPAAMRARTDGLARLFNCTTPALPISSINCCGSSFMCIGVGGKFCLFK